LAAAMASSAPTGPATAPAASPALPRYSQGGSRPQLLPSADSITGSPIRSSLDSMHSPRPTSPSARPRSFFQRLMSSSSPILASPGASLPSPQAQQQSPRQPGKKRSMPSMAPSNGMHTRSKSAGNIFALPSDVSCNDGGVPPVLTLEQMTQWTDQLLALFPGYSRQDVLKDLEETKSIHLTTNRILDGKLRPHPAMPSPTPSPTPSSRPKLSDAILWERASDVTPWETACLPRDLKEKRQASATTALPLVKPKAPHPSNIITAKPGPKSETPEPEGPSSIPAAAMTSSLPTEDEDDATWYPTPSSFSSASPIPIVVRRMRRSVHRVNSGIRNNTRRQDYSHLLKRLDSFSSVYSVGAEEESVDNETAASEETDNVNRLRQRGADGRFKAGRSRTGDNVARSFSTSSASSESSSSGFSFTLNGEDRVAPVPMVLEPLEDAIQLSATTVPYVVRRKLPPTPQMPSIATVVTAATIGRRMTRRVKTVKGRRRPAREVLLETYAELVSELGELLPGTSGGSRREDLRRSTVMNMETLLEEWRVREEAKATKPVSAVEEEVAEAQEGVKGQPIGEAVITFELQMPNPSDVACSGTPTPATDDVADDAVEEEGTIIEEYLIDHWVPYRTSPRRRTTVRTTPPPREDSVDGATIPIYAMYASDGDEAAPCDEAEDHDILKPHLLMLPRSDGRRGSDETVMGPTSDGVRRGSEATVCPTPADVEQGGAVPGPVIDFTRFAKASDDDSDDDDEEEEGRMVVSKVRRVVTIKKGEPAKVKVEISIVGDKGTEETADEGFGSPVDMDEMVDVDLNEVVVPDEKVESGNMRVMVSGGALSHRLGRLFGLMG
ncbi:hypothetical protein HK101_000589, partial [Irineochytrium annulatum]